MKLAARIKGLLFENRSAGQAIAKNTFWLFSGQVASRLFRAILVIYAARVLGAESWGAFSYAIAITTFATTFADFGLNAFATREIAKQRETRNPYVGTILGIKLGIIALLAIVIGGGGKYLTNIEAAQAIMPIMIFIFAFDALRDFGSAIMRAFEKMEFEAILFAFTNAAIVALGIIALYFRPAPLPLAYAYAAGSAAGCLAAAFAIFPYFRRVASGFRAGLVLPIIRSAWPFGLMSLLGIVMLNTDIVMIGWLMNAEAVGFYSAGQKLIQLLYALPALFASALFPRFSLFQNAADKESFRRVLEKSITIAFLLALPLALGGLTLGGELTALIFGTNYASAAPVFQILALTFLIVFPSTILSNALFATGEEKRFIAIATIGAAMNVAANFFLIPPFGLKGAAVATILSQLSSNWIFWVTMKKRIGFRTLPHLYRIISGAVIMAGATYIMKMAGLPVAANVALSAAVYGAALFILREPILKLAFTSLRKR